MFYKGQHRQLLCPIALSLYLSDLRFLYATSPQPRE